MFNWISNHKKFNIALSIFFSLLIIIIMPFVLNAIYYSDAPFDFFYVGYEILDILDYYGDVLTFIGTVGLGFFAVYQNHISQKKLMK